MFGAAAVAAQYFRYNIKETIQITSQLKLELGIDITMNKCTWVWVRSNYSTMYTVYEYLSACLFQKYTPVIPEDQAVLVIHIWNIMRLK